MTTELRENFIIFWLGEISLHVHYVDVIEKYKDHE